MRITRILHREVLKHIDYYSRFNPSPLSIEKFLSFGMFCCCVHLTAIILLTLPFLSGKEACEATSFVFLRKELPVRLANIMSELHLLPNKLLRMPSVELVQSWYERSFQEILTFERGDADSSKALENFCDTLVKIRNRHSVSSESCNPDECNRFMYNHTECSGDYGSGNHGIEASTHSGPANRALYSVLPEPILHE